MNASVQKEESMVMQKKMIGEHFEVSLGTQPPRLGLSAEVHGHASPGGGLV